jgi:integrase
MTLTDFFVSFYAPLRLRGRSENTARLYHCTIGSLAKWLGRDPTLEDLSDLGLARFLTHRASIRSPYTAEKERSQLLSLAKFAFERRLIEVMPCVLPAPLPERIPQAWSVEQIRMLVVACEKTDGMISGKPAGLWFETLVCVLWETAERIGAVLDARIVDYGEARLLARAEYRKGKKRDKLYCLSEATCSLLDELVMGRKPSEKIFLWDRPKTMLWYAFGRVVDRAGLGGGRRAKFHQLRRSAATHFAARGGDATAFLDHSSPRTTKAYLDPRFIQTGPQPCDVLPRIS